MQFEPAERKGAYSCINMKSIEINLGLRFGEFFIESIQFTAHVYPGTGNLGQGRADRLRFDSARSCKINFRLIKLDQMAWQIVQAKFVNNIDG